MAGADSADEKQCEMLMLMRSIIREEITAAIDKLQPQLNSMKAELKDCNKKLTEVERSLSGMEDRVTSLENLNELLQKENTELRERAERLEAHSRRFNLRVFGLDRDVEKGNPTAYMSNFFKEVFKGKKLPAEPEVEIAHRVGPVTKS
ncbi:hypothetical protein ABVT39_007564 [Epinephelus coioides]